MNPFKRYIAIAMGVAAAVSIGTVRGDDAILLNAEITRLVYSAAVTSESLVISRLSRDFAAFAGSDTNVARLMTGLRGGTSITLVAHTGANQRPSFATVVPPARRMDIGNVYISLALAKQRLVNLGIVQPTPPQIKAVLVGGFVSTGSGTAVRTVTLPGVLIQRSRGMGWGNIAQSQGLILATVVNGLKNANHDLWVIQLHRQSARYTVTAPELPVAGGIVGMVSWPPR